MMTIPPTHPFPLETVEIAYDTVQRFTQENPAASTHRAAFSLYHHLGRKFPFSFAGSLRHGHYASYLHESIEAKVTGFNCTTIVPLIYLYYEALGCHPEILQFCDFEDTPLDKKTEKRPYFFKSHFSVVIDVGQKHKYLVDPYLGLFNPILKQQKGYLRLGKNGEIPAIERTYEGIISYTPQEFAELMERLRDPAESLDMLAAGQRVFSGKLIGKEKGTLMVYYDDPDTKVTARLYIPQPGLLDKGVDAQHHFSDTGEIERTTLDLILAKDFAWDTLQDPKRIGVASFSTIQRLNNLLRKGGSLVQYPRLGSRLAADPPCFDALYDITAGFQEGLTSGEREQLEDFILLRTLYETTKPEEKYLFSTEERDARLTALVVRYQEEQGKDFAFCQELFPFYWKLKRDQKTRRSIRGKQRRLRHTLNEISDKMEQLLYLRSDNKPLYDRTMDKVLFAESMQEKSTEDLGRLVRERGLDPRLGYLALVAEFVPYILHARRYLELEDSIESITEKIRARQEKRKRSA